MNVSRKKSLFDFKRRSCTFTRENLAEIFQIDVPTFVFQLLTCVSIVSINKQTQALIAACASLSLHKQLQAKKHTTTMPADRAASSRF